MTDLLAPAPPTRRSPRLNAKLAAVAVSAALVLTGCAAGQRAQTAVETPVLDAVGANVGSIDLRAITIAPPANGSYAAGGSASVQLYIVNNGAPDSLVSVSSPSAKSAALFPNGTTAFALPPSSSAAPTPTPTLSTPSPTASSTKSGSTSSSAATSSSAPSTSAAPTTSAAPSTSASATPITIPLPTGETTPVGVTFTQPQIVLTGLNAALYPAMSIPITFTFANAGVVTVQVSVHLSTGAINAPTLATTHATAED